jgi:L-arabinose isomerase
MHDDGSHNDFWIIHRFRREKHRNAPVFQNQFISTYALSSTVLPIAQRIKVPIIILNVQPVPAIHYAALNGLGDKGKMC